MDPGKQVRSGPADDGISLRNEIDGDLIVIVAIRDNHSVGRLTGLFDDGHRALLQDVKVEEAAKIKRGLLDCILGRTRTQSFRRRGVGSRLLTEFLAICQRRAVREVVGSVVQHDLDATPTLMEWYARHGFKKRVPSESPLPERYRPPNTVWEVVWNPCTSNPS